MSIYRELQRKQAQRANVVNVLTNLALVAAVYFWLDAPGWAAVFLYLSLQQTDRIIMRLDYGARL